MAEYEQRATIGSDAELELGKVMSDLVALACTVVLAVWFVGLLLRTWQGPVGEVRYG